MSNDPAEPFVTIKRLAADPSTDHQIEANRSAANPHGRPITCPSWR